jgi:hypothetical protein
MVDGIIFGSRSPGDEFVNDGHGDGSQSTDERRKIGSLEDVASARGEGQDRWEH